MRFMTLGAVDPNMVAWREEHATQLRRDFTELKTLARTVPPLQQEQALALVAQWNVWTTQAINDVLHATTEEEFGAAAEFYIDKMRAWRNELLALGAHETTAITSLPVASADPAVTEEAQMVEAGILSGNGMGYIIFGAIVLYLGTGAYIASQAKWSGAPKRRRSRYSRRR